MLATPTGFRFSASDLNHFVECEYLAWLESQRAVGKLKPDNDAPDPMAELLARRGRANEATYLAQLEAEGVQTTRIAYDPARPAGAVAATRAAMERGDRVIYQAVLENEPWFGIADFLERVERPSALGAWSYEVVDTKLARRTKPYYLIQLSLYSDLVARVQGVAPEQMHVILDGGRRESFACRDYGAYFRTLRDRFVASVVVDEGNGSQGTTAYPAPIEHCEVCRWAGNCQRRWEEDDHLWLVADIRKKQIVRLESAGIRTMAALAAVPEERKIPKVARETLAALRQQARLQVAARADLFARYELLPPAVAKGFALLPEPSKGDVFFDMEGDPYVAGGLEYLFGADFADKKGKPTYRAWWGHTPDEERRAFEGFIDFVVERRAKDPNLHVYHYASYETTALKRLAGRYGTREAELDDMLRGHVFVDLYRVVRQGLRASYPGYSIKDIEGFYMGPRSGDVKDAGGSIVAYELWLETRDPGRLEAIESYNAEDCTSTRLLRDWLLARKVEAEFQYGAPVPPPPEPDVRPVSDKRQRADAIRAEARARLVAALGAELGDPALLSGSERALWLSTQLLEYHQREDRPVWWMFFERMKMTDEELFDDSESIAGLEREPGTPPIPVKKSMVHALTFPAQEYKFRAGSKVHDPATGESAGEITALDRRTGRLSLKRGPSHAAVPMPTALMPGKPYGTDEQWEALVRLAACLGSVAIDGPGPYRALRDLLCGAPPRVAGLAPGSLLQGAHMDVEAAWDVVSRLDESSIVVQGPPGSGKTWLGARLIVRLMREGKKVGVTALSHRAIHNLLHEIEDVAIAEGFIFRGLKKGSVNPEDDNFFRSKLATPRITNIDENPTGFPGGVSLLAGTAWLFSRAELDDSMDYLFVDEAGQVSLADALAVGTSARNLVLLGDPQQLPQVSQGTHPEGAGASVLEHVLAGHDTIPPDRGLFLERTYRMHPDVCRFISELAYEERLVSAPGRERQRVDSPGLSGTGLRYLPVEHSGNGQSSEEEARVIVDAVTQLLAGGTFTSHEGVVRPLSIADILVVTPYNAQVQTLLAVLPDGAQVGTVDKFQGREAPIVFFSMATSSGEDMPRDLEFLFSRNRLNVAISRARALAVLVASPRLLQVPCRNAAEMRMLNAVCRLVEMASE